MKTGELDPPTARECTRCGRRDRWNRVDGAWEIVRENGEPVSGSPFCIHEWDINGKHNPFIE